MAITPGIRLGPYEVVCAIGAGGMGQVFRARDATLNRDVALKVMPEAFAADADRLARFTREAQVLASLNHPNIAQIYGIEGHALVMELVEGEDLSTIIARGPVPRSDALPIARQIAEALETAHEQGIVHRDLKPANIKVRSDGAVKVLDFGLAKALGPQGASGTTDAMNSPTLTARATQAGMILGTAAYMAPEQAKGRSVDRRADIWAFGVVFYEMLTGHRLFDAEDVSETLAAVLTREVSLAALPADTPGQLRVLLRNCLTRDPKQRLRDIGDARIVLDRIVAGEPDLAVAPAALAGAIVPRWQRVLPWAVAGALAVAVAGLWGPWRVEVPVDRPLVRLNVDLGAEVSLPAPSAAGSNIAISPDGTRLVYASGTPPKLFTRRLDQPTAAELPGTEGAAVPFLSPDGQWVGFVSHGKVNKISVEGGAVVPLGDVAGFDGAGWSDDGAIFVGVPGKGLLRIPDGGGPPQIIAEPGEGVLGLNDPEILPGGNAILFTADRAGSVDNNTIDVVTLADRTRKTLVRGGASPRYLATSNRAGHLVYVNNATLFAIPFDLDTLGTRGTAVPVLGDVAHESLVGVGQFDISRAGTVVYRLASGGASRLRAVQWVDPAGTKEPLLAPHRAYADPSVSPDGTRVALVVAGAVGQDVWVYDSRRDAMTRLTFGGELCWSPTWSPDGQYVVFASMGKGIVQARADGASPPHALTESKYPQYPRSFTPDGTRLAYFEQMGTSQVWTVPLEGQGSQLKAGTPERFLGSRFNDRAPAFSPDGRWLAYQSDESGQREVYVRTFPPQVSGTGGKWQISNGGGWSPRWSRGGHELVYRSGDQIMAVRYTVKGDTFVPEKPRVWIAKLGGADWDLAPDGTRVVVLTGVESADAPTPEHHVVFLQNFFDELRRRVPLGQ